MCSRFITVLRTININTSLQINFNKFPFVTYTIGLCKVVQYRTVRNFLPQQLGSSYNNKTIATISQQSYIITLERKHWDFRHQTLPTVEYLALLSAVASISLQYSLILQYSICIQFTFRRRIDEVYLSKVNYFLWRNNLSVYYVCERLISGLRTATCRG